VKRGPRKKKREERDEKVQSWAGEKVFARSGGTRRSIKRENKRKKDATSRKQQITTIEQRKRKDRAREKPVV